MSMLTFLMLMGVLAGRLFLALVRGAWYIVAMPARTALAVAPYMARPRWALLGGLLASLGLATAAIALLGRGQ